jgi:hypothetical protein
MHTVPEFLTQRGYAALFVAVLAERLGLALIAALLSHYTWFYLGKRREAGSFG